MALFGKRQVDAQVSDMTWSRVVQLERQQWVRKRGTWAPSEGTRNVEKHTETYWDTVTDMTPGAPNADGIPGPPSSSTRTELRTRFYYTYESLEWRKGRTLRAAGTGPSGVAWPDYTLEPEERIRDEEETYAVTFTAADKRYEASLPEQEWRCLELGLTCHLSLGLLGGVKKVTHTR
jgi:hypothetical protein